MILLRRSGAVVALAAVLLWVPLGVSAAGSSDKAASLYEKALIEYKNDQLSTAIIHLKSALQEDPRFLSAHVLLGKAHVRSGDGAAGEKELILAERLGADRSLTVVALAQAYLLQDKYQEVLEIPSDGLSTEIQLKLMTHRGQAYLQTDRIDEADQAYTTARDLDAKATAPILGRALVAMRRGTLGAAERFARRALELAPDDSEAWYILGSIKHAVGDRSAALDAYNRVLERKPLHLGARVARVGVRLDQGERDKALEDVDYIRKEYPYDPRAAYLKAVILAQKGDGDGAKKSLQEANSLIERLQPEALNQHGPSLLLAGLISYSMQQWENAYTHLRRYVKQRPDQIGARKLLGAVLLKRGDHREAIHVLEPAVSVSPNDYRLYTLLGTAYTKAGLFDQATDAFDKALGLNRGAAEIRVQRALSSLAMGSDASAMAELATVFDADEAKTDAGVILAILHFKRGDYKAAATVCQKVVEAEPDNLTALNLLGSAHLALGRLDAARQHFRAASARNSRFLPARLNLAKLAVIEGRPEQAERLFREILSEHKGHVPTMIELAKVAELQGQGEDARRWAEKAYATEGRSIQTIGYLIDLYLKNGEPEKALEVAQQAQTWAPEDMVILDGLGRTYLALGKPSDAQVFFRRMSLLAGFDAKTLLHIAKLQLSSGDADNAVWSLQKAVEHDESFVPARVTLIEALLFTGNIAEASKQAKVVRAKQPGTAIGYRLMGDVSAYKKDYKNAVRYYELALAKNASPDIALRLFRGYGHINGRENAMAFLRRWVDKHPGDARTTHALAEGYLAQGDLQSARMHYERLLEITPGEAAILNNLAYIYAASGDERALDYARRAYDVAPQDPAVNDTLGWLMVNRSQYTEGLRYLRNAHSMAANDPEIRYHIAVALEALGRRDEAVAELEMALEGGQAFNGAEDAHRLLGRLRGR